jgi:carotenoid cleavage dioxygenase
METIKAGGPYYEWHPDKQCHVAIVPRRGTPDEIRWFRGPACSAGHMMNAFNDGDMLHLDLCLYEGNCFPFFPAYDGSPHVPAPPLLSRMSFNLADSRDTFERKPLGKMFSEMPQIDERLNGKPYTYGYTISFEPPRATSRLGKWNVQTGELVTWDPGEDSSVQETKFVPYGPGEEDGYLIVPVNRVAEMRSDIAILDAKDIAAGPIALIRMPTRIKASFHGQWVPAETLESGLFNYP